MLMWHVCPGCCAQAIGFGHQGVVDHGKRNTVALHELPKSAVVVAPIRSIAGEAIDLLHVAQQIVRHLDSVVSAEAGFFYGDCHKNPPRLVPLGNRLNFGLWRLFEYEIP